MKMTDSCRQVTCAILPKSEIGELRFLLEAAVEVLLALIVLCRRNRRVEVVDSQYARFFVLS